MARTPDYYSVLEVDPHAEFAVIRAAYRVLALHYHPDRPTGSTARMIALNQAWAILGDSAARDIYDGERANGTAEAAVREPAVVTVPVGGFAAGPLGRREAPGGAASSVLGFGRYAGSSIADLAHRDRAYLEWLAASPAGRPLASEINRILTGRGDAQTGSSDSWHAGMSH